MTSTQARAAMVPAAPAYSLWIARPRRGSQRASAALEFAAACIPLLLAATLVIEGAGWHMLRQAASLALLEAARAGATGHARPRVIDAAFAHAMLPLHIPAYWRIDILKPDAPAYVDFADTATAVPGASGLRAIRNDYQALQHAGRIARGWPAGRGPRSGKTIFQANTLRLRLELHHRPWTPLARAVVRAVASDRAGRQGLVIMKMEIEEAMQSHPVDWGRTGSQGQ
jgi:hypothetical protein